MKNYETIDVEIISFSEEEIKTDVISTSGISPDGPWPNPMDINLGL